MELIDRQMALDRIDKTRKELLDLGMYGAEHILVHYGRRVIEELPTIDAPDRNVGKWICHGDGGTATPACDADPAGYADWLEEQIEPMLGDWVCDIFPWLASDYCEKNCSNAGPDIGCLRAAYEEYKKLESEEGEI